MVDTADLARLRAHIEEMEKQRDFIIKKSRDVIKASKLVIYSVHRNEMDKAASLIDDMKQRLKELDSVAKSSVKLTSTGAYKVAIQEYVEAMEFFSFMSKGKLLTSAQLNVDEEHYLLGIFDLAGELSRKAINSVIKGDYKTAVKIKEFVSDMYGELMQFDLAGGELRSKFDSIKYELKKLEDLMLELKLKEKI